MIHVMSEILPKEINHNLNKSVLRYLDGASAHSDVTEALALAIAPLGDVQTYCPDPSGYKYVVVASRNIIFGFAMGMNQIAFRLDALFKNRAIETGGKGLSEVGPEWVVFTLFRNDWPQIDLTFWARKAYVVARQEK